MNRNLRHALPFLAIVVGSLGSLSCDDDNKTTDGGNITPSTGTPIVAVGPMTKGSVKVAGIEFSAATGAKIKVGDDTNAIEDNLRSGMVVRVKGRRHDDGRTGEFEAVETEPELRGALHGKGADDFTVLDHHVVVDDTTVFEDRQSGGVFSGMGLDDLAENEKVEVHGGLDDLGNLRATRVERRHDDAVDELRGIVTGLTATSFKLGALVINFSGATPVSPAGAPLAENVLVEVEGALNVGGSFDAAAIHVEDVEDQEFEPEHGQELEVEGFVHEFTAHPGTFFVDEQKVTTTASTSFENGAPEDLANNVKIEAEGHFDSAAGVLAAEKIQFKRLRVVLEGTPSSTVPFVLFGKTIAISSATENTFSGIGRARVRGHEDSAGNIVAERIENGGGGGDRDIIQGEVTAEGTNSLTIIGISATTSAETEFQDLNENLISATAFFDAVTARTAQGAGTLVKLKGTVTAGTTTTMTVDEAELED